VDGIPVSAQPELTQTEALDGLALLGQVARLLNTGLGAEETVTRVAETLRRGLRAESVVIWLREPNATTMRSIGAPPRDSRSPHRAGRTAA
jgi:GAF domain-containing protein